MAVNNWSGAYTPDSSDSAYKSAEMSLYYPDMTGCGDTNCLFEASHVHTNGGCRCEKELMRSPEGIKAARTIRYLREQLRQSVNKNIRRTLYQ